MVSLNRMKRNWRTQTRTWLWLKWNPCLQLVSSKYQEVKRELRILILKSVGLTCDIKVLHSLPSCRCSTPSLTAELLLSSRSPQSTGSRFFPFVFQVWLISLLGAEPQKPAGRRHDWLQLHLPLHPLHHVHQVETSTEWESVPKIFSPGKIFRKH